MLELVIFIIATILYFIMRYLAPGYNRVSTVVYYLSVVGSQFFFNMSLQKELCGNSNYGYATLVTLVPWIMIFGIIQAMLIIFPGWKQPFSNTFGYLVTRLAGINSVLFTILKAPKGTNTQLEKTIHNIYSDPSLFINEINPSNFNDFFTKSRFMFKAGVTQNSESMISFRNLIEVKELVSEFVWYMLSGLLVTTVSYNAIANANCSQSLDEMKKRHAQYEKDVNKQQEEAENAPPERVYYIRD
jgi:hypothetical protein